MLRHITMFSGNTILGDGSVIMIVDPNGIATGIGSATGGSLADDHRADEEERSREQASTISMLLFRAGTMEPKAIPLSLVTRLEEFSVDKIESSNGRDLVQYRGSLMPLVYFDEHVQRKSEGSVPMLVFSDAGRSMGLVVDEIIDIVEDRLDIQVGSDRPGILGSAVIKTKATEVVDVGHFLPQAFEDWFQRKEMAQETLTRSLLFVDDAPFFRNMLGPVLKAAGYSVTLAESAKEAIKYFEEGRKFDVVVSDIEMPDMNGFEFAEALKRSPRLRHIPILALSASCTPASIERGRQAGFDDYIAKFDRAGLIAALKEVSNYEYGVAA